ncbi:STAS domain-containing protein [Desulfovibrio inopinatus]|uniref:STAS domain-containing protein n=1 Tax=Desulfovibrio inopinatus TaxID=102109 RepID=UPI0004039E4D|nr:STAS domain-containing protein [Desulfovibrio inopinatus]
MKHTTENNITILEPDGRLDAIQAPHIKNITVQCVKNGMNKIVMDLSNVIFVDSAGLGILVSSLRQLANSGGDMKICGLRKEVRALFELTRLDRVFDIYQERDAAVHGFSSAQ